MTRREFLAASAAVAAIPVVAEALPVPEVKGMTFIEALDELRKNRRYVQRIGWGQKHLAWNSDGNWIQWPDQKLFTYEIRDAFMKPGEVRILGCENIWFPKEDAAATDWRLVEPGRLDTSGDHENMTYAEAGTWLAAGNCGYVQRTGWGTRHIARCDAGIQEGGKPVMILELRQCYNIESERAMTFDDFEARDWRTVSIQETQRPGPDWLWADWNYRHTLYQARD